MFVQFTFQKRLVLIDADKIDAVVEKINSTIAIITLQGGEEYHVDQTVAEVAVSLNKAREIKFAKFNYSNEPVYLRVDKINGWSKNPGRSGSVIQMNEPQVTPYVDQSPDVVHKILMEV